MDLGIFDWFIMAILVIVIFMILIGKGQEALRFFNGRGWDDKIKDKNYDPKREERATLIFSIVLLAAVAASHFLDKYWTFLPIVTIVIAIAAVIGYMLYIKGGKKD
ncbi:MAG: hypothetical protein LKM35_06235 [Lachnospiraceae bacterium]|jgi:hypothetical protein|nr:hypothetical protein [Lachnospiraceae bacterium]MCI1727273.1 hypothetical protein [Lachnospiraceae bacterium]